MPKLLPFSLLIAVSVSGCVNTPIAPAAYVPGSNPRVVERDLSNLKPSSASQIAGSQGRAVMGAGVPQGSTGAEPQAAKRPAPVFPALEARALAAKVTPPPTVAAIAPAKVWEVKAGDMRLASTFERWSKESAAAGMPAYKVLWDASKHVLISGTPTYSGSFLDAVESALKTPAIQQSDYPLEACLYEQSPPLIRITRRGEQADTCPDFK